MFWIGFDIGGTFTDIVAVDTLLHRIIATKTPTTPQDPSEGAVTGIRQLLHEHSIEVNNVHRVVHGTTIATNTLIEGTGARVGFLCNEGFGDVVEIGRMFREDLYDINFSKTPPLSPRDMRVEIRSRIDVAGNRVSSLDEEATLSKIIQLQSRGAEAYAVGLLHSYSYPDDELYIRDLILQLEPSAMISLSHELSGEYGEVERWGTAIVNAYLMPKIQIYLTNLAIRLTELGITVPIEVMQSNGGIVLVDVAARLPVRLLESGPAGGVAGMARVAGQIGAENLITFDMGGTSTDVCTVRQGRPTVATERTIAGHSVRTIMADIHSIGAGGGSIARVDTSGALHVGPESAGSNPGPVALKTGGVYPTITDADLVLGYLNPDRYCAGRLSMDLSSARESISRHVALPTGTTVEQAALGMVNLAVQNMASAIRTITTQRALDPRDFTLVAAGGAGPVHAGLVAQELQIPTILIPAYPAQLSAQGMLFADYRSDASQTVASRLDNIGPKTLEDIYYDLETTARLYLGEYDGSFNITRSIEMCYEGQQYGVLIPISNEVYSDSTFTYLQKSLDREFMDHYGFLPNNNVPRIVSVRTSVEKQSDELADLQSIIVSESSSLSESADTRRRMTFAEYPDGVDAPVHDRQSLKSDRQLKGPAVIESDFSTIVIFPNQSAELDLNNNVILRNLTP
jgi:N-methylhydantoinase A